MKLPFWNSEVSGSDVAVFWNGEAHFTYEDLITRIGFYRNQFSLKPKTCILAFLSNTPDTIALLTGAFASGHAVLLADASLPDHKQQALIDAYRPGYVCKPSSDEFYVVSEMADACDQVHRDLCVLLSTSGSSGSPKYVRLSKENVLSNALAICDCLDVSQSDIASCHLDLHYSYGFSVMSSHLIRGAALAMDSGRFTDRDFWRRVGVAGVTHLPGVPFHHEMLTRLGHQKMLPESVMTLTQAGGRLNKRFADVAFNFMNERGGKFYVMYGQTEASPRMATLPSDRYFDKAGSAGCALGGGEFKIELADESSHSGEIVYTGPNVMMGYAMSAEDLSLGDVQGTQLYTGDMGYLDEEGFLFITGRMSRMGKIYGLRLNLDELEQQVDTQDDYYLVQQDNHIGVVGSLNRVEQHCESALVSGLDKTIEELAVLANLPPNAFKAYVVHDIPLNARGKVEYAALGEMLK